MEDEAKVGPIFFNYDADRRELSIVRMDEVGCLLENVSGPVWEAFVKASKGDLSWKTVVIYDDDPDDIVYAIDIA